MTGSIKLKIPHEPPYHGVALLVVGGLAARLDLSYEKLEDLQLALESVLENGRYAHGPEIAVEFDVEEDTLELFIGPLDEAALKPDLEDQRDDRIALGRLLGTLVEDVRLESRDGKAWLRLEKRLEAVPKEGSLDGA